MGMEKENFDVSSHLPSLDEAIRKWSAARRSFVRRSGREAFDAFHDATTTLFLVFAGEHLDERWAAMAFNALRQAIVAAESAEEPSYSPMLSLPPR